MKSLVDNDRNVCIVGQAIEFVTNPQSPRTDYVMFKLNQEGDTLMSRYYQYPYWQLPYELMIIPDTDSLMLLGGTMSTAGHPTVTIMDKNMQIHTVNHFYISGLSYLLSADFWLNESEFLMAGPNSFSDGRYLDGYIGVYRMNTAGQVFEELVLSIPDTSIYRAWHKSIAYANDSTVYVAGFQAFANNMTPNAVYLFVIDREMNILGSTGFFYRRCSVSSHWYIAHARRRLPDAYCQEQTQCPGGTRTRCLHTKVFARKYRNHYNSGKNPFGKT